MRVELPPGTEPLELRRLGPVLRRDDSIQAI